MSPQVMNLSLGARLLFIGLITQADDEGRGVADPRKLKSAVFPGDEELNSEAILGFLEEVRRERLCSLYSSEEHGEVYALPSWNQHQRVEKPRKSYYPKPPRTFREDSGSATVHIREESGTIPGGSDLIGSDLIGGDLHPPAPLKGGRSGLTANGEKNPRAERDASLTAWRTVVPAIDQVKGTERTWADVAQQCVDADAYRAAEQVGFKRIAERDRYTEKALQGEFREVYARLHREHEQAPQ